MNPYLFFSIAVALGLYYAYWNGANDCANTICTAVGTDALSPRSAVALAGLANAGGLFVAWLLGNAVAKTIAGGIVITSAVTEAVVLGGLAGAIAWGWFATRMGIPVSITHSLVGGVMGAGIAHGGMDAIALETFINKIALGIVLAPFAGLAGGYIVRFLCEIVVRPFRFGNAPANRMWRLLQIPSSIWLSASHGMNDGQNAIGIIALAYLAAGFSSAITIKFWMICVVAIAIGLGTAIHSSRVLKTASEKIMDMDPIDGFAAQTANAPVLTVMSIFGIPVSTTHVAMSCLFGAGTAKDFHAVDWRVSRHIVMAWFITIPVSGSIGFLSYTVLSFIIG